MSEAIRILVVDDEAENGELLKKFLERGGFSAKSLTDPTRTVDELKRHDYHLVVLDMMMPKMPGVEVLKAIRAYDDDLAVVVATGYPNVNTAVESLKLSANDYVRKPVDPVRFVATVRGVLEKKGIAADAESMLHQHIGQVIHDTRVDLGLTLKQLAKRSGLSVSLLSQIERAESSSSISSLYRISAALKVNLRDLFTHS